MTTGVSSGYIVRPIAVSTERLSSHGGKRSLSALLSEREHNDPVFKSKMTEGRKLLSEEIHDVDPVDSFTKRRLRKGLSQQELASILGTSQSHIAKIEAGTVNIYFGTATKLADALDITLDNLRKLVEISKHQEFIVVAS